MQRASDIAFEVIYWFLRGTDFEFTYKSFLELLEGIDSIKVACYLVDGEENMVGIESGSLKVAVTLLVGDLSICWLGVSKVQAAYLHNVDGVCFLPATNYRDAISSGLRGQRFE